MNYTEEQLNLAFDKSHRSVQDILFTPEIERKVQKIGIESGLLIDQLKRLNTLTNLVILGILSEKDFVTECTQAFGVDQKTAESIEQAIARDIFTPIETLKVQALKEEAQKEAEERELFGGEATTPIQVQKPDSTTQEQTAPSARTWEKIPEAVPENLPTEEATESFLPNLAPKPAKVLQSQNLGGQAVPDNEGVLTHPFEEKMKKVFTGATTSARDLTLETPAPQITEPSSRTSDPYREPIE